MNKVNALILLVNSLSKAEKKAIYLQSDLISGVKVYLELFKMIESKKIIDGKVLANEFALRFPRTNFHPTVKYLYDFILSVLVKLKVTQNKEYSLYNKLMAAKLLYERNLDKDYYATLKQLKKEAKEHELYHLLLTIERMELDYLRISGFINLSEKDLLKKQHKMSDTFKTIRQINEQSSLYELLLLRIEKTPASQRAKQKQFLNDLIVSEITLVSNLKRDVFEIQKLHQLFQGHYLIYVGDYKSAINSFIELDKLFVDNKALWSNPPFYYVSVLEGILQSFRAIREYDKLDYFLRKLRSIDYPSQTFDVEILCIDFIYSLAPYLDNGIEKESVEIVSKYTSSLIQKRELLTPYRNMQLALMLAKVHMLRKDYGAANKQLSPIVYGDSYVDIWLYHPIQLLNLAVDFELGNYDLIISKIRSIKRKNTLSRKTSKFENVFFRFLNSDLRYLSPEKKGQEKAKLEEELAQLDISHEDQRILKLFDFRKWMLSKFEN
ncbi:hypothetical protein JGH11_07180 [Dysgonomonas sp. Marseille-P4677]|uniref:hypothetical protein n=1 Tax=Dysgonomonas sp. Marseille-P4677 TaxID=2364790 RepID=UPI001911C650|nr:hypothetical protein [Dysgonomonas sp. Marseille-P4677]MBK5720651.1 hypothetical protein [Dysgonomonas sp. Marseille-P4677]